MATNYTLWIHVIMIQHSHEKYTMDACYNDSNLNITMQNTWWIYVLVQTYEYSIANWTDMAISKVFISIVLKHKSIHVITGVEVKHGRNHLITGHS
jgi:hypothetical protein